MRDFYCKILGVSPSASEAEIRSAYRKLVSRAHPDITGNSKASVERFLKIQEAYEALMQNDFPAAQKVAKPPRRPARPAASPIRQPVSPAPRSSEPGDFMDELFETFAKDVESLASSLRSFFSFKRKKR